MSIWGATEKAEKRANRLAHRHSAHVVGA
jgi:hypothetical protein